VVSLYLANARRVIGAIAGAAVGIALAPLLAPALLGILGFSAIGPVAGNFLPHPQAEVASNPSELLGTAAAVIQAGIGNVAAGSAFAVAQSIAMGGAIPAAVTAVGAGLGAGVGTAAAGATPDDEDQKEEDSNDEDATGGDGADDDGTPGDAGEGTARTGGNRCRDCKRRRERYCWHH
jgi:hypothetical protein